MDNRVCSTCLRYTLGSPELSFTQLNLCVLCVFVLLLSCCGHSALPPPRDGSASTLFPSGYFAKLKQRDRQRECKRERVRGREREREREPERERKSERERECVCACVCVREREREEPIEKIYLYVYVSVYVSTYSYVSIYPSVSYAQFGLFCGNI